MIDSSQRDISFWFFSFSPLCPEGGNSLVNSSRGRGWRREREREDERDRDTEEQEKRETEREWDMETRGKQQIEQKPSETVVLCCCATVVGGYIIHRCNRHKGQSWTRTGLRQCARNYDILNNGFGRSCGRSLLFERRVNTRRFLSDRSRHSGTARAITRVAIISVFLPLSLLSPSFSFSLFFFFLRITMRDRYSATRSCPVVGFPCTRFAEKV